MIVVPNISKNNWTVSLFSSVMLLNHFRLWYALLIHFIKRGPRFHLRSNECVKILEVPRFSPKNMMKTYDPKKIVISLTEEESFVNASQIQLEYALSTTNWFRFASGGSLHTLTRTIINEERKTSNRRKFMILSEGILIKQFNLGALALVAYV